MKGRGRKKRKERKDIYFYLIGDIAYLHCPGDSYGTASSSAFLTARLHESTFLLNRLDLYLDLSKERENTYINVKKHGKCIKRRK